MLTFVYHSLRGRERQTSDVVEQQTNKKETKLIVILIKKEWKEKKKKKNTLNKSKIMTLNLTIKNTKQQKNNF